MNESKLWDQVEILFNAQNNPLGYLIPPELKEILQDKLND